MAAEIEIPLIVVVEDEPMIAELYELALEDAGFSVKTFLAPNEAMAWIEGPDARFAGIVTDVNLGGGYRGWDLAHRAREVNASAAVVYCTGFDAADWASKGVPESVVLTKPFVPAQVVVALVNQLNAAAVRLRE